MALADIFACFSSFILGERGLAQVFLSKLTFVAALIVDSMSTEFIVRDSITRDAIFLSQNLRLPRLRYLLPCLLV